MTFSLPIRQSLHPPKFPSIRYLINRKENDCTRAEVWKGFKAGGYKLFKKGHVQKVMVTKHDSIFGLTCSCLPEMKKDRVYKIKINITTDSSNVCLGECSCPAGRGNMKTANTSQQHCLLQKISI